MPECYVLCVDIRQDHRLPQERKRIYTLIGLCCVCVCYDWVVGSQCWLVSFILSHENPGCPCCHWWECCTSLSVVLSRTLHCLQCYTLLQEGLDLLMCNTTRGFQHVNIHIITLIVCVIANICFMNACMCVTVCVCYAFLNVLHVPVSGVCYDMPSVLHMCACVW